MEAQIPGALAPDIFCITTAVFPYIQMYVSSGTPNRKRHIAVRVRVHFRIVGP
jgi:hypothetical protein